MKVLKALFKWYKIPIPYISYFCTLNLARKAWPKLKSHALDVLAKKFNIKFNHHNALDDALTCGKLVQIAKKEYDPEDKIENFLEHMGVDVKCFWTKEQSEEAWKDFSKVLEEIGNKYVIMEDE
jgi:DNA polymerase-3 subunit epsilon